jgi:tetratricopeptide (TPR) repeat protein
MIAKSGLWQHAANRQRFRVVSKPEASNLKERLADIRSQTGQDSFVNSAQPWIEAAAVLATFDPSRIRSLEGERIGDIKTFSELVEASVPLPAAGGRRTLELSFRRKVLQSVDGHSQMRALLSANRPGPDVPVQHGIELLLEGHDAIERARSDADVELLAGLAEALLWVENILDDLPAREDILKELASVRLTQPLQNLVGEHFKGREHILGQLRSYFEQPLSVENVFYLHGIGGAGKSTVLAKFAMDLRASEAVDLVVYLNFDRPTLDIREPLTVLHEIVVQMALQTQQDVMKQLQSDIVSYMRRFSSDRVLSEAIFDAGGNWDGMIAGVAEAIRLIPGEEPILILLDTFERAQRFGESVVREFWRMLSALGSEAPRLRIVAAGRVDSYDIFQNTHPLGGLEKEDVAGVLTEICGKELRDDLVDEVIAVTNGRPLGVRLAGLLFRRIGLAKLEDPHVRRDALLEVQSEQAEAVLYNRILGQIGNPRVRKLARPGLLLHHVSPRLIEKVLAPASGMSLDPYQAHEVFDEYAQEVDLVEVSVAEWGENILTHRADVRSLMVDDLRAGEEAQIAELDRLAIDFFMNENGAMARAEEIYHRLWTDETIESIEARWTDGCVPYLLDAVTEIPRKHRPWLANRVGIDLPMEVAAEADQDAWETYAVRTARSHLNRGDIEGALKLLEERRARLPGSPLYAIEADACSRLGDVSRAVNVIDRGLESTVDAGSRRQAAELWLVRSIISERNRQFAVASRDAARAYKIAEELAIADMSLRAIASLLRLHRKSRNVEGPSPETLIARANGILDDIGDNALADQPSLMRSLAGELGPTRPEFVAAAVQMTGADTISTPQVELHEIEELATRQLNGPQFVKVADIVEQIEPDIGTTFRDLTSTLVSVALDRGILKQVASPVAQVLAAEVDQLTGAFPSPSMLHRVTGNRSWWK